MQKKWQTFRWSSKTQTLSSQSTYLLDKDNLNLECLVKQEMKWFDFHKNKLESNYPIWPVEVMVKIIFGNYLKRPFHLKKEMKVLDIGCGFGNNLLPFYIKGCKCYGVEITKEICEVSKKAMATQEIHEISFQAGHNRNIPFEKDTFDLLISNNVLHYEPNKEKIQDALKEYTRVLKPNGAAYIMTVGPKHKIFQNSIPKGEDIYEINNYDFRDGERQFYFGTEKNFSFYLKKFFNNIEIGRTTEKLMGLNLDFYISFSREKNELD